MALAKHHNKLAAIAMIVTVLGVAGPVNAVYVPAPSGTYLELADEIVYWYDSVNNSTVSMGPSQSEFEPCPSVSGLGTKVRCGYCTYVPHTMPPPGPGWQSPGSGWRNGAAYTYGACVQAEVVNGEVLYRPDVRIKHTEGGWNSYNWTAYYQPILPIGGGGAGTTWVWANGEGCKNDPPVSFCATDSALTWNPSQKLPANAIGYCFRLEIRNGSAVSAGPYLKAEVCNW